MQYRRPSVFYAIPCGDFYSIQNEIILAVSIKAQIDPIIAEDDLRTKGLWEKIKGQIDFSDLFVADISSGSSNIILELGYAIREKSIKNIGIFISNSSSIPSDLNGFVLQKYTSFNDFQGKLVEWLCQALPALDSNRFIDLKRRSANFQEDFLDQDLFHRRWSIPPGGSFVFTGQGVRISNMHLPMLTTTLEILKDCKLTFRAKIERSRIGWSVQGTKFYHRFYPEFCVMFNLDEAGIITPHVLNMEQPHPTTLYHIFSDQNTKIEHFVKETWINSTIVVRGSSIEVSYNSSLVFSADFSKEPYAQYYNITGGKGGQVGVRCYPDEEATINYIQIEELS
jgi:hypothetical protein